MMKYAGRSITMLAQKFMAPDSYSLIHLKRGGRHVYLFHSNVSQSILRGRFGREMSEQRGPKRLTICFQFLFYTMSHKLHYLTLYKFEEYTHMFVSRLW